MLANDHQPVIKATIIYNPLDVKDRAEADLVFQDGKSLSAYVEGLPEGIEWCVALDFQVIPKDGWALTFPKENSNITISPIPEGGGDDGKSILALVATVALSAFAGPMAGWIVGTGATEAVLAIATAAVSVAGGLLINALIPPPQNSDIGQDSAAYGMDGPKNTSTEGVPIPILYGEHGIGGNITDLYTENSTDDDGKAIQFLYGRIAVSEGPIEEFGDIFINDQTLESFEDVEVAYSRGSGIQPVNNWFSESVSLVNQSRDVTTTYQRYTTSTEVDKIRLDFVAPIGLNVTDDKGRRNEKTVELNLRYRKVGDTEWYAMQNLNFWSRIADVPGVPSTAVKVNVNINNTFIPDREGGGQAGDNYDFNIVYRVVGSGTWVNLGPTQIGNVPMESSKTVEIEEFNLPSAVYEFGVVVNSQGGDIIIGEADVWIQAPGPTKITDKLQSPVRRTFKSPLLEEAVYEIEFRRTDEEGDTEEKIYDKIQLSDVGEIIVDPLTMPFTAWLAYRIKLTGQLNSIPTVTGVCKGRIIPIYDHNGAIVNTRWSDNPADIALDMLLDKRYGGATEPERIDFAGYAEWREYCNVKGLTFNGLFFEATNVDDALKHVYIAGRAQRVSSGAKLSIAIDRETGPSMMFGDGNMRRNSFKINYLPFADRINDLEVSYLDKEDGYKSRTVRVTNDLAIGRGEPLKTSNITLKGIVDYDRALREGVFRMNYNRLVNRVVNWESPVEAIGCTVGDMVTVQHEMPGWGTGGRIKDGTDTVLTLDKEVQFTAGDTYRVLVHQNKRMIYTSTVTSQTSNLLTISTLIPDDVNVTHLIFNSVEYNITSIIRSPGSTDLVISTAGGTPTLSGQQVQLWNTDVIDDVTVVNPGNVKTDQITLTSALPSGAPAKYSNYMFGQVQFTKKPFRIKSIGMESNGFSQITAIEYVPEVYSDDPNAQAHNYSSLVDSYHVQSLVAEVDAVPNIDGTFQYNVTASWLEPLKGLYTGAEVQVSVNGSQLNKVADVTGLSYTMQGNLADIIIFKVIANSSNSDVKISAATAPTVTIEVAIPGNIPLGPTGWTGSAGYDTIALTGDASPNANFKAFIIYGTSDHDDVNFVELDRISATRYVRIVPRFDPITRYAVSEIDSFGNESPRTPWISVVPTYDLDDLFADLDVQAQAAFDRFSSAFDESFDRLAELDIQARVTDALETARVEGVVDETKTELTAAVDGVSANLTNNYYTAATVDSAIAASELTLNSSIDGVSANLTNNYYTLTQTNLAIAASELTLNASIDGVQADLTNNYYTSTSTDDAISAAVSTFSTTVGANTTAISATTSSINGVKAVHGVKINNNGAVSGFGLISELVDGAVTSDFIIDADAFRVGKSNSLGTYTSPFQVIGSTTYIKKAVIQNADIDTLKIAGDAVTVASSTTLNNALIGGANQLVHSGSLYFDYPGYIIVLWSGAHGYYAGAPYTHDFQLYVNGSLVQSRGGTAVEDYPMLSYGQAVGAGTVAVNVYWSAQGSSLELSNRTLSLSGGKR